MTENDKPDGVEEPEPADDAPEVEPESKRGQIRFQDADTTKPREPTVGEQRARRRALQREQEAELAEQQEVERKSRLRRRILIGGGVTVGVVALVAVWYAAATPDEVTAHCVADDDTLATTEEICADPNYVTSHGGYHSGGFFFLPIPGGGVRQYHYNYGGSVANGRVTGGTTAAPSGNTRVKSSSGRTVQRGGLGVSSGGKSGGKSGGS